MATPHIIYDDVQQLRLRVAEILIYSAQQYVRDGKRSVPSIQVLDMLEILMGAIWDYPIMPESAEVCACCGSADLNKRMKDLFG
jgi:hypothetical protein